MTLIALDIETVPVGVPLGPGFADRAKARFAERLAETKDRTSFERHTRQRIVAVGIAAMAETGKTKVVADAGPAESALLQLAFEILAKAKQPRLVTANGNSFDLPVLRYRAIGYGMSLAPLKPDYFKRFDATHIDLLDVLSNYGASERPRLLDLAELCGLRAKQIATGADVVDLVDREDWATIRAYVGNDAAQTLAIALRVFYCQGQIPARIGFEDCVAGLIAGVRETPYDAGLADDLEAWIREAAQVA